MNLTRSASQVSTTSELLQRNSGARWAAPKDDDPPSPPAKPPPLTKGKSTKIKRRGTSLALASGERVHMQAQAWGRGRHGQLGSIDEQSDGLRAQAAGLPQPIFTDVHVHAAACGADFTLLLSLGGDVWACGANGSGQLGSGLPSQTALVPRIALEGVHASRIACGARHAAAVTATGRLFVWGENSAGQLGLGHTRPLNPPAPTELPLPAPDERERDLSPTTGRRRRGSGSSDSLSIGWREVACGAALPPLPRASLGT